MTAIPQAETPTSPTSSSTFEPHRNPDEPTERCQLSEDANTFPIRANI